MPDEKVTVNLDNKKSEEFPESYARSGVRDVERRREYMRNYMRERRAKAKSTHG